MTSCNCFLFLAALPSFARGAANADAPPVSEERRAASSDIRGESLPEGARMRLGDSHMWHPTSVTRVAFSSDGKAVWSAGDDGTVGYWTLLRARSVAASACPTAGWNAGPFAPDGKTLAVAGTGGGVHMRGRYWCRAVCTPRVASALVISSDGKTLAGYGAGEITLWNTGTGEALRRIQKVDDGFAQVHALALSPDSKLLASSAGKYIDRENDVRLWDTATGEQVGRFHTNGKAVAASLSRPTARLWRRAFGRLVRLGRCRGEDRVTSAERQHGRRLFPQRTDAGRGRRYRHDPPVGVEYGAGDRQHVRPRVPGHQHGLFARRRDAGFRGPGRRGATWDPAGASKSRFTGGNAVRCLGAFSPGGTASFLGADHTIRLWETAPAGNLRLDLKPDPLQGWLLPQERTRPSPFPPTAKHLPPWGTTVSSTSGKRPRARSGRAAATNGRSPP